MKTTKYVFSLVNSEKIHCDEFDYDNVLEMYYIPVPGYNYAVPKNAVVFIMEVYPNGNQTKDSQTSS